jgi:hypothetical protein
LLSASHLSGTDPAYPDERLIVCRNPLLGQARRRKREELLGATEAELNKITGRVASGSALIQ